MAGGCGAPERIRTPNLLIRSQTLYPVELRAPTLPYYRMFPDGATLLPNNDITKAIRKAIGQIFCLARGG